ncbi:uncharacterized protein K489DRAFT_132845 [Dissoconium aciculare CBS 342.82]|uniref:Uncharacterized protein n=1 Tax=Dissoconium aciculare CBS 342.82 TaxID=1314786 RepID=A0A6J3LS55_9PEZI|nr:uncharacterized protein K489DRAFT_132845 [Dissoconium aciculare CBS 342.82]KAF1818119.1 hypothetical protein K489DRAFT_132845 [Dissoconium aciculare CBS 342.82]
MQPHPQPASQPDDIMAHGREKASSWNHGWEKLVKLWCRCCTLQTILPRLLPSACLADVGSAQPRRRDDEGNACRDSPIPCSACARSVRVEVVAEEHDGKPMGPWPCPSQSSDLEVDHDVGAVPSATSVIIDVARLGDRPPQIHEDIFTYIYISLSLSILTHSWVECGYSITKARRRRHISPVERGAISSAPVLPPPAVP